MQVSPPTSRRGYASAYQRKSAIKTRRRPRQKTKQYKPIQQTSNSTTADEIIQLHVPLIRLSEVLKRQPSLFNNSSKRGSKIHAANKHIQVIDRLAERYTEAKVIYLGGNDLKKIQGFEQFTQLVTLSLSNNLLIDVQDLYVLAGSCPTLRTLSLEGNDISHTPYYRERVIAAMPELNVLDGKRVEDEELRGAVNVEAKYAKSMDLLFQNDCLIHKLKRTAHQISLHSDLHSVRNGLRRGSIGDKIPITFLRTNSTRGNSTTKNNTNGTNEQDFDSMNGLSIDQFLHRWRYIDTLSNQERIAVERRITDGAYRFYTLLQQGSETENGGSGTANIGSSNSINRTTTSLWDEAFGQMLMVQQSSIAKLVDMCRAKEQKAKELVLKSARKDPKGYLKEELLMETEKAEEREQHLKNRISELEKSVAEKEQRVIEVSRVVTQQQHQQHQQQQQQRAIADETLNVSDLLNDTSMTYVHNVSNIGEEDLEEQVRNEGVGLNSQANIARTLVGSFENVSRHQNNIDTTLRASALQSASNTAVPSSMPSSSSFRRVQSRASASPQPRDNTSQSMHQSNISPAPRIAQPPVPTPRATEPSTSSSSSSFRMMLPTPRMEGGNRVGNGSNGSNGSTSTTRRNRFHTSHTSNTNNNRTNNVTSSGRRRTRRGPNFSVSPPPSASRSPLRLQQQQQHTELYGTVSSMASPQRRPPFSPSKINTSTNPNNTTNTNTTNTTNTKRKRNRPSSRSMSPQRLPSRNTYRLVVRQLITAVQHGRSLYGRKISRLSEFFDVMDKDQNGMVSREEFHRSVRRLGIGLTNVQVDGIMAVLDEDHSGRLNKKEFLNALRMEVREEKKGNMPYPSPRQSEIDTMNETMEGSNGNRSTNVLIGDRKQQHVRARIETAHGSSTIPNIGGTRWVEPIERRPTSKSPWKETLRNHNPVILENPIVSSPERQRNSTLLNSQAHSPSSQSRTTKDEQTKQLTNKLKQANDRIVQYHDLIDGMLQRNSTRPTQGATQGAHQVDGTHGDGGGSRSRSRSPSTSRIALSSSSSSSSPTLIDFRDTHAHRNRATHTIAATMTTWWHRRMDIRLEECWQKWVMSLMFERLCSEAHARRYIESMRHCFQKWIKWYKTTEYLNINKLNINKRKEKRNGGTVGQQQQRASTHTSPRISSRASPRTSPLVQTDESEQEEEEEFEKVQEIEFKYRAELEKWKQRRLQSLRRSILRRQIRQTFYVWSSNACEHRRTKWHEEKRQHVQQKQADTHYKRHLSQSCLYQWRWRSSMQRVHRTRNTRAMEYYITKLISSHFQQWSIHFMQSVRKERRIINARSIAKGRAAFHARLMARRCLVAWRSCLRGTSESRHIYVKYLSIIIRNKNKQKEKNILAKSWSHFIKYRLECAMERTERLRVAINSADARAVQAEARVDEVEQLGRMHLNSARNQYSMETDSIRLRMKDIHQEVERLTVVLTKKEKERRMLASESNLQRTEIITLKAKHQRMVVEIKRKEEEDHIKCIEIESRNHSDLNIFQEQHVQDLKEIETKHEMEIFKNQKKNENEMETLEKNMNSTFIRKITAMAEKHATEMHVIKAKHSHAMHMEREHLGSALVEARSLSEKILKQTNVTEFEKEKLTIECTRMENERQVERAATMNSMRALNQQMEDVSNAAEETKQELKAKDILHQNQEIEQRTSMERYRTVALALESATETLKEDIKNVSSDNHALKHRLDQELAKRQVAERLLEEKNLEIRRLTQGVRMKDVATEQAVHRAKLAEKQLKTLGARMLRGVEDKKSGGGEKRGGRNVYVDITLNGREQGTHQSDRGNNNNNSNNNSNNNNTNNNDSSISFSERLEQSLDVAGRQVEELADKEHSLWRRDASFQVWRSEHGDVSMSENRSRTEIQEENGPLDAVERRLVHLQSRIHRKVNAVASVATPMSVRGRRNMSQRQEEDEDDEMLMDADRSFEL